jgi:hypothetical protein
MGDFLHGMTGSVEELVGFGPSFDGTGFEAARSLGHLVACDHLQQVEEQLILRHSHPIARHPFGTKEVKGSVLTIDNAGGNCHRWDGLTLNGSVL